MTASAARRQYPRVTAAALALTLALGWQAGVLLGRQAEDEVRRGQGAEAALYRAKSLGRNRVETA